MHSCKKRCSVHRRLCLSFPQIPHRLTPKFALIDKRVRIRYLRPRGGRKLALQNGKVEGSEVGKNTALFGGRGEESFTCGSLPGSSCERRERRETERRETERRERERERRERDERDEKEMREMRERERQ